MFLCVWNLLKFHSDASGCEYLFILLEINLSSCICDMLFFISSETLSAVISLHIASDMIDPSSV